MQSAAPTSTLPPIPLSKPYSLPQASHALDAPLNCTQRLSRRETCGANGGRGGIRAQRQFVYSRFRQVGAVGWGLCTTGSVRWRRLDSMCE